MIIMKYSKTESAAFIPHLDTLRTFIRTLTRAEIEVEYSKGFNPHMCLYFSNPIPLGLNTISEYCTIETDYSADGFIERFNKFSPENLKCLKAHKVLLNPNFANILCAAKYEIEIEGLNNFKDLISDLIKKPLLIDYFSKGEKKTKDFSGHIYSLTQSGDILNCVFSSGAENLRHDIFVSEILRLTNLKDVKKVLKTAQYLKKDGKLTDADSFFI